MSDSLEQEFDDFQPRRISRARILLFVGGRRDRRDLPGDDVRLALHRPALVLLGRLLRCLRQDALDPRRAVRRLRGPDGWRGRCQHDHRLPGPAVPSARLPGADRPGPLPRRGRPDPGSAAGLGGRRDRALRRGRRQRPVALLPAVGQPRAVPHLRPLLPQGRRLLRLHPALAALPGRLRDRGAGALGPQRAASCTTCTAASGSRGPATGCRRPRPSSCPSWSASSCSPRRSATGSTATTWSPARAAGHRDGLHRPARRPAGPQHPGVGRADLRGAVLPHRLAPHLAAARASASRCSWSPRSCSA